MSDNVSITLEPYLTGLVEYLWHIDVEGTVTIP